MLVAQAGSPTCPPPCALCSASPEQSLLAATHPPEGTFPVEMQLLPLCSSEHSCVGTRAREPSGRRGCELKHKPPISGPLPRSHRQACWPREGCQRRQSDSEPELASSGAAGLPAGHMGGGRLPGSLQGRRSQGPGPSVSLSRPTLCRGGRKPQEGVDMQGQAWEPQEGLCRTLGLTPAQGSLCLASPRRR